MATRVFLRLLLTTNRSFSSIRSRSYTSLTPPFSLSSFSLLRLRPLVTVTTNPLHPSVSTTIRGLATRQTTSSLNDSSPNWTNRPPKETILLDGCDFEHWLVVVETPEGEPTRDEIINGYIKTLAQVVGSEDEARMKIYSVSTRCYYAFGALVSEELSYKLKELPGVRWVLPDSYLDVKNKDYGGEPFINGEAVPYDPKYHEEWVRNSARANERNRRNDRPRNFDRSRNFERRRDNMQNNRGGFQGNFAGPPPSNMGGAPPSSNMGGAPPPSNVGGAPPSNNFGRPPPSGNYGGMQQGGMGGPPPNVGGGQPNNWSGPPQSYNQGPPNMGGSPPPPPNYQQQSYGPNGGGGMAYQQGPGPNREYKNSYAQNAGGGNPYQTQDMPGRDMPPPRNYQ